MEIESILFSGVGLSRFANEDNFCFELKVNNDPSIPEIYLESFEQKPPCSFAVFDGMGGLNKGEIASKIAAIEFKKVVEVYPISSEQLLSYYMRTNRKICNFALENSISRIGTTAVTLSILDKEIYYSNIGDSKFFRIRNGQILQLSEDHSESSFLVKEGFITEEEVKNHPSANKLTQHLGIFPDELQIEPFITSDVLESGDIYLLVTDGVTNFVTKSELVNYCSTYSLSEAAKEIVKDVYDRGATDNFSFIIVKVGH